MGQDSPAGRRKAMAARVLAVLVILCLIRNIDSFAIIFKYNQVGIVPSIIGILVLLSGVGASIGLLRGKMWGFMPLYFFLPASTLFLGMSILPVLPSLFPISIRSFVVLGLNSVVLIYSVFILLRMMEPNVLIDHENS